MDYRACYWLNSVNIVTVEYVAMWNSLRDNLELAALLPVKDILFASIIRIQRDLLVYSLLSSLKSKMLKR